MKLPILLWMMLSAVALSAAAGTGEKASKTGSVGIGKSANSDESHPPEQEFTWKVRAFVADGSGTIWGIASKRDIADRSNGNGGIQSLAILEPSTSQWQSHSCLAVPNEAYPEGLVVLSDGRMVCLWRSGEQSTLTIHQKGEGKLWCTLNTRFIDPRMLALSDGGLAITERGPQLARIPADGSEPVLTRLPDEVLSKPTKEEGSRSYANMHAVECGDGSIWLWSYALQKQGHLWRIDGLRRWAGSEIAIVEGLPFKPGAPISALIADGKEHFYVALAGVGLSRLNWVDGNEQFFEVPEHVFDYIERLVVVNGALHVITCPQPDEVKVRMSPTLQSHLAIETIHHYDTTKKTGGLWHLDVPTLQLKPLLIGLDTQPRFGWGERPLLSTARGLLVGAVDSGPWWLPAASGKKPFLLDQGQDFPLRQANDICGVGKDGFLACSNDGNWALQSLPGDQPAGFTSRLKALRASAFIIQDKRLHLWAMRKDENDFAEWDGKAWHSRDTPKELEGIDDVEFAADSHDQGWLIPTDGRKTFVVDFTTAKWRVFDSLEQAVFEVLAPHDKLRIRRHITFAPISHNKGNAGFLDWNGSVHVCLNGKWTTSDIHQIAGPDARVSGVPFYNAEGTFCLPLNNKHFHFRKDGQWVEVQGADTSNDRTYLSDDSLSPRDCPVKNVVSTSYDRHGIGWLTTQEGGLWKWLDGVAVKVTGHGRSNFLKPLTLIAEVITDADHNAFMRRTGSSSGFLYDILPSKPAPLVKPATVAGIESNAAVIQFDPTPGIWHRWRIDHASWQQPAQKAEMKLESLLPGDHQLEIENFDDELTPIGELQIITFNIKAATDAVLSGQIQQLSVDDLNTREAAAQVLKAQGAAALPALKQALHDSGENVTLQWWLSAIIQHIERAQIPAATK